MRPIKNFRIDPDLKRALSEAAKRRGVTESDVIRSALREHLRIQSKPKEKNHAR